MFRCFSFESASRRDGSSSDIEAERAAMNVSPTQTRLPTPPPCSVGELAQKFNRHNLRVEVQHHYPSQSQSFHEPLTPPGDDDFACYADSIPAAEDTSSASCPSLPDRRAQRQANMRLQCSTNYARDISALVERMVEQGEQCSVCPDRWKNFSFLDDIELEEDEGVSLEDAPRPRESLPFPLRFRRSGDRVAGQACVMKSVRMRKKPARVRRSAS